MQTRPKPTVGQTLYSLNVGNAAGKYRPQKLTPVEVISVGRKYFKCRPVGSTYRHEEAEYHLDTWREKTDYTPSSALYETEKEWDDEKERDLLFSKISNEFSHYAHKKTSLSIETLRQIAALLPPTP